MISYSRVPNKQDSVPRAQSRSQHRFHKGPESHTSRMGVPHVAQAWKMQSSVSVQRSVLSLPTRFRDSHVKYYTWREGVQDPSFLKFPGTCQHQ